MRDDLETKRHLGESAAATGHQNSVAIGNTNGVLLLEPSSEPQLPQRIGLCNPTEGGGVSASCFTARASLSGKSWNLGDEKHTSIVSQPQQPCEPVSLVIR